MPNGKSCLCIHIVLLIFVSSFSFVFPYYEFLYCQFLLLYVRIFELFEIYPICLSLGVCFCSIVSLSYKTFVVLFLFTVHVFLGLF